jgi:hypothetical protein
VTVVAWGHIAVAEDSNKPNLKLVVADAESALVDAAKPQAAKPEAPKSPPLQVEAWIDDRPRIISAASNHLPVNTREAPNE